MEVAITKMSSKGQIVIPTNMRNNIQEGDKLVLIREGEQFIIKKINSFSKLLENDIEFAKRTEEALKRIDSNNNKKIKFDDFIEEMEDW